MTAAILGFLKALPELVDALKSLGATVRYLQDAQTDSKYNDLKEQVNVYTKQIENSTTNDERLRLVRELNRVVSM